jgi:hypothetical protein
MKAFLMYKAQDFDLQRKSPWNAQQLIDDLELETLLNAMARRDQVLFDVAKSAILSSLDNDPGTILYRQDILKDCLKNHFIVLVSKALIDDRWHQSLPSKRDR